MCARADFWIVQQYASKGLILNPGKGKQGGADEQVRLPWIDITTWIDTDNHIIYGETGWLSVFRAF